MRNSNHGQPSAAAGRTRRAHLTGNWLSRPHRAGSPRDYRLIDIQHAVLPTLLPLPEFYQELVKTQSVLNRKHLGWSAVKSLSRTLAGNLARGQTNTLTMLWKFNSVHDPRLQLADHGRPVLYELAPPPEPKEVINARSIYIHPHAGHNGHVLDAATESFVSQTRSKVDSTA